MSLHPCCYGTLVPGIEAQMLQEGVTFYASKRKIAFLTSTTRGLDSLGAYLNEECLSRQLCFCITTLSVAILIYHGDTIKDWLHWPWCHG